MNQALPDLSGLYTFENYSCKCNILIINSYLFCFLFFDQGKLNYFWDDKTVSSKFDDDHASDDVISKKIKYTSTRQILRLKYRRYF